MKDLVTGILAHVDAGKTTLSEGMLYACGTAVQQWPGGPPGRFSGYGRAGAGAGHHHLFQAWRNSSTGRDGRDAAGYAGACGFFQRRWSAPCGCWTMRCWSSAARTGSRGTRRRCGSCWSSYRIPTFLFINKMDLAGDGCQVRPAGAAAAARDGGCIDFGRPEGDELFMRMLAHVRTRMLMERLFAEPGGWKMRSLSVLIRGAEDFSLLFRLGPEAGGRPGSCWRDWRRIQTERTYSGRVWRPGVSRSPGMRRAHD